MSRLLLWLQNARTASLEIKDGQDILDAFEALLLMTWQHNWRGACHDTSACLYMILSEMGLKPELVIGEVMSPAGPFDHSWIEVDGKIFDVAVSLPDEGGEDVGPPIFATLDLDSAKPTRLRYGIKTPTGLYQPGLEIAYKTLDEYSEIQSQLWDITSEVADQCGFSLDAGDLKREYGHVRRKVRGQ